MRFTAQLVVLVFMLMGPALEAPGAATVSAPRRLKTSAPNYVRLADWASANRFTVRWLVRDKTLQLSNNLAKMVFTVAAREDRRGMEINGVRVLLAFPLLYQKGVVYISQTDLQQTLGPILTPPRNAPGIKVKTICLDPGHGGKDPGYRVRSSEEKRFTLLLAQELREQLKQAGFEVILTRSTDATVERPARPGLAAKRHADLFVSLHFNAFPSGTHVSGVETYSLTPAGAFSSNAGGEGSTGWVTGNRYSEKNLLLAYQLQKSLVQTLPAEDRGVKRARFEVLRLATMPSVLIEGGFMSHPMEGKRILDPAYRKKMASAIVDGIVAYKRAVKG